MTAAAHKRELSSTMSIFPAIVPLPTSLLRLSVIFDPPYTRLYMRMIILDRTAKATDNIRLKPGGPRVSQHKIQIALPKMRQLWMRKPRSGKTGFVASHHDKGYDWKRAGNEIRWLSIMVSTAL